MYLKLKAGKYEKKMRKLTQFVLSIFDYFAQHPQFTETDFFSSLGVDGAWFETCYRRRPRLRTLLDELAQEPVSQRKRLFEAMEKDVNYIAHMDEETFRFAESILPPVILEKAAALTTYLYDEIFVKADFQVEGEKMNRIRFETEFYRVNFPLDQRDVCPVCLQASGRLQKNSQIDHFFPKAKYPALIFQPENLPVICKECNEADEKGQKDPMQDTDLTELFLPYRRAAEEETQLRIWLDGNGRHLQLVPIGGDEKVLKRIENFDRLYGVSACWNRQADEYLAACGRIAEDCRSTAEAEEELRILAKNKRRMAARDKSQLIESRCYDYMEGEGHCVFLDECEKRLEEQRKLQQMGEKERNIHV